MVSAQATVAEGWALVSYTDFIALVPPNKQSVGDADGETSLFWLDGLRHSCHHANLITMVIQYIDIHKLMVFVCTSWQCVNLDCELFLNYPVYI